MTVLNLAKIGNHHGDTSLSDQSLINNQLSVQGTTEKLLIGSKADSEIPVTDLNKLLKIYV